MTWSFDSSKPDIAPGAYFTICASADITTLDSEVCNRNAPAASFKIQNERRDGLRLLKGDVLMDSLTWGEYLEGTTEGDNPAPQDFDTKDSYSLSRVPDGLDTNQNDFDFKWTCASPHRANYTYEECLCLRTVCTGGKVCNIATGLCEVVVVEPDVIEDAGVADDAAADEAVADAVSPDSGVEDAGPMPDVAVDTGNDTTIRDVGRHDSGPGVDAAIWVDLGGSGGEDTGGESADGCSAGRHGRPAPYLLVMIFSGLALAAGQGIRRSAAASAKK